MRKIIVFTNVSLDGYFEAPGHDLSWASRDNEAFETRTGEEADSFLFGHRTYDMMKAFWPTPQAKQALPEMARVLNETHKFVASHAPFDPGWQNVTVLSGDVPEEVRKLKEQPGKNLLVFGSNELVVSLLEQGLIDELQILVNPVAIGKGTSLFAGLSHQVPLTLKDTRRFKSGTVMLTYEPEEPQSR